MARFELMTLLRIDSFVERYDTQVSRMVAQLKSEHIFIDSTDVEINRYGNEYTVCILLNYTLTNGDLRLICETLGNIYWTITSSIHISGYMLQITDSEIHKYFDK